MRGRVVDHPSGRRQQVLGAGRRPGVAAGAVRESARGDPLAAGAGELVGRPGRSLCRRRRVARRHVDHLRPRPASPVDVLPRARPDQLERALVLDDRSRVLRQPGAPRRAAAAEGDPRPGHRRPLLQRPDLRLPEFLRRRRERRNGPDAGRRRAFGGLGRRVLPVHRRGRLHGHRDLLRDVVAWRPARGLGQQHDRRRLPEL